MVSHPAIVWFMVSHPAIVWIMVSHPAVVWIIVSHPAIVWIMVSHPAIVWIMVSQQQSVWIPHLPVLRPSKVLSFDILLVILFVMKKKSCFSYYRTYNFTIQ